jgi:hypothetical protein
MSAGGKREDARRRLEERYRRLADARKKRPAAAVAARFTEIDGATLGALVSIELFTTVMWMRSHPDATAFSKAWAELDRFPVSFDLIAPRRRRLGLSLDPLINRLFVGCRDEESAL